MNDIIIPENCSSNCDDSIYYSLLKHFNLNYQAYNIKYFYNDYFTFSPNDLTNCIKRGKVQWDIWSEFYGINLSFTNKNKSTDLNQLVTGRDANKPIVISIDPFYCYWSPFYQKAHYFHLLLIVEVKNNKYKCFDVYYNTVGYVEVDCDFIEKHYNKYFIFDFNHSHELKIELLINKIKVLLNNFDDDLDSKKKEMSDYFLLNDRKILFADNLDTSSLLMHLLWIAEDKKHFQIALKYIEDAFNKSIFTKVFELLLDSSNKFKLLKSVLTKYALTGVIKKEKIDHIISNIFSNDMLTVEQLMLSLKHI